MTSLRQDPPKTIVHVKGPVEWKQAEAEDAVRSAFSAIPGEPDPLACKDSTIVIDLSETKWFDLGALLWQILVIAKWKQNNNAIRLSFPYMGEPGRWNSVGIGAWSFLRRWGYFDVLSLLVDDPVNLLSPDQVQYLLPRDTDPAWMRYSRTQQENNGEIIQLLSSRLLEISTLTPSGTNARIGEEDVHEYLLRLKDRIVLQALGRLCGWDTDKAVRFVSAIMGEGLINAAVHSKSGVALAAMRVDSKYLSLALADNGIGIPESLRQAYRAVGKDATIAGMTDGDLIKMYTDPAVVLDSALIRLATEPGTSSTAERAGMGLFYLKQTVLSAGGELRIRSGDARVDFSAEDKVDVSDGLLKGGGTVVRALVPVRRDVAYRRQRASRAP